MMKRIYLKSMTGLVLAGAVTGSLMLSATDLAAFTGPLKKGMDDLQGATMWFMNNAMKNPDNAGAGSTDAD